MPVRVSVRSWLISGHETGPSSTKARSHRQPAFAGTSTKDPTPKQNQLSRHISEESESEKEGDKPRKKQKLLESDMPWFGRDETDPQGANPACTKTIELLRNYNKDIEKCKFFVSIAPGAPENIPPTQWE